MHCTVLLCVVFLLSLCAVYETKHTLYVANVFPNNGEYVTINQFSVDDFSIGTFDVGTLNANSKLGVNITSTSSISFKGASVLVGGQDVAVSTTSPFSTVSIDASATFDVYGSSVSFSSAEGDVLFQTLTSFELISTGSLSGSYSGFYSVGGDQVDLQSSKGGSNFFSYSNIDSQATTTFIEGGNLITFNSTSFEVEANLAIDVFTSYFEAEVRSFTITAFRNNILLQTGTLLDIGGKFVNMNANDLITIRSVESQVILLSEFDGSYNALDAFTIDSDSEVTFSADNGDLTVNAGDTISIYANEGVAVQSTSLGTFSVRSSELTAFGQSIVVQSTNSDVSYTADTLTANAFTKQSITAYGDLLFYSLLDTSINGNAGIDLFAERGTLTLGSSTSTNEINFTSQFSTTLSGTSVLFTPTTVSLTSGNNIRFATSDEDRLDSLNIDTTSFATSSGFILLAGGDVFTSSPFLTFSSSSDMDFIATENQSNGVRFTNYNHTDSAVQDLTFNSRYITTTSTDNTTYTAPTITINADDKIYLRSSGDFNFNLASNLTFTTVLDTKINSRSKVIIGNTLAAQIQIDSGKTDFQSGSSILSYATSNITIIGTNVNFDADSSLNFGYAKSLGFSADRFEILSGTQTYNSVATNFNANNILLQSPPNQDISIRTGTLSVVGDTTFAGRNFYSSSSTVGLTVDNTIRIQTSQEDSIVIDVDNNVSITADDNVLIGSSEDTTVLGGNIIAFSSNPGSYETISRTLENIAFNSQSYNQSAYFASSPTYVSEVSDVNLLVASTQTYTTSNTFFISRGGSNSFTANTMNFQETGSNANTQISIESAINNFSSVTNGISFANGNFEISEDQFLNIVSTTNLDFTTTGELVFFGAEFDISAIGTLSLITPQQLTIAAAVISFDTPTNLKVSTKQIAFEAGLHKTLTIAESSSSGTLSVESTSFTLRSNNELNFNGKVWSHTASTADSNGAGISFKTYAMSSSILFTASTYSETSVDNNVFYVDDVTNRGGDDINLYSDNTATYVVDTTLITSIAPVTPITLPRALSQGMFFHASGSEYDPTLGYNVGMLLRTEGTKSTDGSTTIQSDRSVYYTAGTYNDHVSHNGRIVIQGKTNVNYRTGLDLEIDSQKSSAAFTAGDSNILTVGQSTRIESVDDTSVTSDRFVSLTANRNFEVVAEFGGVQINLDGADDTLNTVSTSFNLEGGGAATYSYGTDSYTATAITLYAFSKSSFVGTKGQTVTAARHIYYESSPNNDISFNAATSFTGTATAGSVLFDSGVNTNFHALQNTTLTATNDVTFFSKGSFRSSATKLLTLSSVTNQIYTGIQRIYYESLGSINVGAPLLANTPIINIYAGGNNLRAGVDLTASGNFLFTTAADTTIFGKNLYSRSSSTSSFESNANIYLISTSTNSIGKDVFFKAAESMDIETSDTLTLTAKVIKFEYDTLAVKSTADDISLSAAKTISLSGATYSSTSASHTVSAKTGVSIASAGKVAFTAKTALTYNPKGTANWLSYGQIELDAGTSLDITATGTSANMYFQTKDSHDNSFILLQAANGLTFTSTAASISIEDVSSYTLLATGSIGMTIGDSVTGVAEGDLYISSHSTASFTASYPQASGSDFQVSSTGTMYGTIGKSMTVRASRNIIFEPDVDLVFAGGDSIDPTRSNRFTYTVVNSLTLTTGNNYNANTLRTQYNAQTFDMVSTGINPENSDGVRISTTGFESNIYAEANGGSTLISAIGNININGNDAVTLTASGVVQLLSKTGNILFNTIDVNTPIQAVAGDSLLLSGKQLVDLVASGVDTGSGYIDIHAAGYKNLGNVNPIVNGTIGIGFFAKDSSIKVSADDSSVRMASLNHFAAIPSVNGTLLVESNGQSRSGVGINVESTIIAVFSELDVAFEAANIGFFDYGVSLYDYDIGVILPESVNVNRPTISSSKDQTYVAYGHNSKGNAIELITSVPNAPITLDTGYVNFYSGGSLLFEGEVSQNLFSLYQTVITSASSVILEGNGLNTGDGIYLSTRTKDLIPTNFGSNIEFYAGIDAYIGAAGRIIDTATNALVFITGNAGTIGFTFDEGASFDSPNGNLLITAPTILFSSFSDISMATDNLQLSGTTVQIYNNQLNGDSNGNIVFGDPNQQQYYYNNGGTRSNPNIIFTGDALNLITPVVDMANTVDLEIPFSNTAAPLACNAATEHQVYLFFAAGHDNICSCVGSYEGWTTNPTPNYRAICFPIYSDVY